MIGPGAQAVFGTANDAGGVGVADVEYLPEGAIVWEAADGTLLWRADVNVPPLDPTFSLQVQATDHFSQTSAPVGAQFTVDAMPPSLTIELPSVLSGAYVDIGGTASDLPSGGQVVTVGVQLDDDTAPWQPALVYAPKASGDQTWLWTWDLPVEDGVTHVLRAQGSDVVGNIGSSGGWQETMVDTVAPQISVTVGVSEVHHIPPGVVLTGTVSDGGGVSRVAVHINTPWGESYERDATINDGAWSLAPHFPRGRGIYTMYVEASDQAGNVTRRGPYHLQSFVAVGGRTIAGAALDLTWTRLWLAALAAVIAAGAALSGRRRRR